MKTFFAHNVPNAIVDEKKHTTLHLTPINSVRR